MGPEETQPHGSTSGDKSVWNGFVEKCKNWKKISSVLCFPFASGEPRGSMSLESIVQEIKAEIEKLNQVLRLLGGGPKTKVKRAPRRKMSAAGRRRISMAQKARWAKVRARKK